MYLGVHYFSDILGGYLAGFVWLVVTITGVETLVRRRRYLARPGGLSDPTMAHQNAP